MRNRKTVDPGGTSSSVVDVDQSQPYI